MVKFLPKTVLLVFLPANHLLESASGESEDTLPLFPSEATEFEVAEFSGDLPSTPDAVMACPPWFLSHQGTLPACLCADTLKNIIQCSDSNLTSYVAINYCVAYDASLSMVLTGPCPYSSVPGNIEGFWVPLPRNISQISEQLCGPLNREGLLCGRCLEGYGISVHSPSLKCVNCQEYPHGWAWFLLTDILLQTLFFLFVFFFRISVTTEKLNGFLLFGHIISSTYIDQFFPQYLSVTGQIPLRNLLLFVLVFYKLWVLEFFTLLIPTACFNENLSALSAVAIRYVSAFYPFFLILCAFILVRLRDCNFRPISVVWKPYQRVKLKVSKYIDLNQSLIHTFSTIIVLSYSKLALVSYSLLFPINLLNSSGETVYWYRWYLDAEIQIFDSQHLPYAVLALVILVVFVILPPVFLLLYPLKRFRFILHKMRLDPPWLNAFMDVFQGCYKDGSGDTRDLRCFAALYFVLRMLFIATRLVTSYEWQWNVIVPLFVIAAVLFGFFHPYKIEKYNAVDVIFLSLLALVFYVFTVTTTFSSVSRTVPSLLPISLVTVGLIPILYFIVILLHHIVKSIKILNMWKEWVYSLCQHWVKKEVEKSEEWPYRLMEEESSV